MTFSLGFKKYFANTSWLMAERVSSMVVALFVGIYVARYLGPSKFGLLSYSLSLVALFSPLSKLGLDKIVVREIVKFPEKRDVILGSAFGLKIAGALMLFSVVSAIVFFQKGSTGENILVLVISAGMLLDAFEVCDFYNQAAVRMKYSSIALFVANICNAIFKLWLIFVGADLVWFAVAVILQKSVLVTIWVLFYRAFIDNLTKWQFEMSLAKCILRDSWPLIFSSLAVVIYMKVDQVMLKLMMDSKAVGEYAVAVGLSEVWYFVPVLISQSVFPAIVNAKKNNAAEYKRNLQKLFVLMSAFSYAVIIPTYFLHDFIVQFLYGSQYTGAGDILVVHVFALIFVSFGVVSGSWLLAENYTGLAFWRTFVGCLCNVFANFLMIPRWGGVGAAWATVISYAVAAYFFDLFIGRMRYLFRSKTYSLFFVRDR